MSVCLAFSFVRLLCATQRAKGVLPAIRSPAGNKEASFYSSASDPALSRPGGGALRMQLAGGGGGGDDGVARGFGGEGEGEGGAFGVGSLVPWALLAVAAGGVAYFGNSM